MQDTTDKPQLHKITNTFVDSKRKCPGIYRDCELRGFALEVTPKLARIYFVENNVRGTRKSVRRSIGKHGVFTAETARDEARKLLLLMSQGINPNQQIREKIAQAKIDRAKLADEDKVKEITLSKAFRDYVKSRRLKPSTIYGYDKILNRCLKDWLYKPLVDISKEMVERRYQALSDEHPAQANQIMRVLRAIFNYADLSYEGHQGRSLVPVNPVRRLSQIKSWNRIKPRQSVIKIEELQTWYEAVMQLRDTKVKDYLCLLLFSGLRKQEAASLKWHNVDFTGKTIKVEDTKNHEDHILPMSDFIYDLLLDRWQTRKNDYVFPGRDNIGRLIDPRKQVAHAIKAFKRPFLLHDLRRTFATVAKRVGIDEIIRKRLMNHKLNSADITEQYTVVDVEWLRASMNKISKFLLDQIKEKSAAEKPRRKIVAFRKRGTAKLHRV